MVQGPRSELTAAEHIAAISLARRMISRLVLLLRVLSCAGGGSEEEGERCRCHMSLRFCHSLLELGRLPAVPCHSAWLETAGFHRGMFGCAGIRLDSWNNILHHFFFFFNVSFFNSLLQVFSCLLLYPTGLNAKQVLCKQCLNSSDQTIQLLVNQQR